MDETEASRRQLRVLVIDDNVEFCDLLEEMLNPLGAVVQKFACPATALQTFIRKREPFDVVLLDYYLPHMSGEQTMEWFRRLAPQMKIVLCSAASKQRLQGFVADGRADAYLCKPFRAEELMHTVVQTTDFPAPFTV
jgi:CheY-like chemotaxis protein